MLDDLERDGYIRKITFSRDKIKESLKLAHRDVKVAEEILNTDCRLGIQYCLQFYIYKRFVR